MPRSGSDHVHKLFWPVRHRTPACTRTFEVKDERQIDRGGSPVVRSLQVPAVASIPSPPVTSRRRRSEHRILRTLFTHERRVSTCARTS